MANLKLPMQEVAQDEIQALIENNPCAMCRAAGSPVCKCKGLGGSGGGGPDRGDLLEMQAPAPAQNSMRMQKHDAVESMPLDLPGDGEVTVQDTAAIDLFDLEEMAEFLLVSNDSGRGVITIRPKPSLLLYNEKEIQELIRTLKMAFEQFKLALEKKGIPVDNFTITLNKNELIVREAFIKELVSKNLLPKTYAPNLEQENKPARLTPFKTTPSPRSKKEEEKEDKDEEEKEAEHSSGVDRVFNPSPFSFSLSLTKLFGGRS